MNFRVVFIFTVTKNFKRRQTVRSIETFNALKNVVFTVTALFQD